MVHKWIPCHREAVKRSHVDRTIVLLKIGERFVPIVESAIEIIKEPAEEVKKNVEHEGKSCDEAKD